MKPITRHITTAAAVITFLIALLILGNWLFGLGPAEYTRPVKFNTGLCLLLSSIALFFQNREILTTIHRNIIRICSVLILCIAGITVLQYIFQTDLYIDQLIWKEKNPLPTTRFPGRMTVLTSSIFTLYAITQLLLRKKRYHYLLQVILITCLSLLALIFLVYITQTLGTRFSIFVPASLHTSFTLLILFAGVFFSYPLRYIKFSFQKKVSAFFLFTILLLLIIYMVSQQNVKRFRDTAAWVEHTNAVLLQNLEVKGLAQQVEASTRGFVISGNPDHLLLFDSAVRNMPIALARLREITSDNKRQQHRVDSLERMINENITLRKEVIQIRKTEGFEGIERFTPIGSKRNNMKMLLALIEVIETDEKQLLDTRTAANEKSIRDSSRIIVLFQITSALLLIGAFIIIYKNTQFRNRAEKEIRDLNENLERKVEEKTAELMKTELHFRHILDNLLEGAQIIGFDWRYKYVNDAFLLHGKYNREELIGYTVMEKYPGIEQTEIFKIYQQCFSERTPIHLENEFLFPDGSKGWFELSFQPVPEGIFILSVDITARKQSEILLKELNDALERRAVELQASNTELERFAYVASHDLQEPLRMVSSFLHLLEKKLEGKLDDPAKQYINFAVDGSERMKKLIQDLLEYSRVGTNRESLSLVDCNEVMKTVQSDLSVSIQELQATINAKPLPVIKAVQPQMIQLFQNLVGNALKYHSDRPLVIEVGYTELKKDYEFFVKDNGIGIDEKFFEKIFIIFQRLHNKTEYAGTGIGLSICKKIVERHGGTIRVESKPGEGSCFYFTIPKHIS